MSAHPPASPRSPRPSHLPLPTTAVIPTSTESAGPSPDPNPDGLPRSFPGGPPPMTTNPFPPGSLVGFPMTHTGAQPPPPRASLSSMLFLTAFFFLMSGGNNPQINEVALGPDGSFIKRVTELDVAREVLDQFRAFVNGTSGGNWTEPPPPRLLAQDLVPPEYRHDPQSASSLHGRPMPFFKNITGFYREAHVHPLNLTSTSFHQSPSSTSSSSSPSSSHLPPFFRHLDLSAIIPIGSRIGANETSATELRGTFDWGRIDKWEMNLKERSIDDLSSNLRPGVGDHRKNNEKNQDRELSDFEDWAWVKGSATLFTSSQFTSSTTTTVPKKTQSLASVDSAILSDRMEITSSTGMVHHDATGSGDSQEINYNFYGLHHLPNGTYTLLARPEGYKVDVRDLPRLYRIHGDRVLNVTRNIILRELEREVEREESVMISPDARGEPTVPPPVNTKCPLQIYLTLPPLPRSVSPELLQLYENERTNPTGIGWSLPVAPHYSETGVGLGMVVVAEECGFIFGVEGGRGMGIDEFWRKGINYAAFATLTQLTLLLLLVRQMEITRTPSTLTKVSLWTIVLMGISDSWIFSAHVVVGIVSNNKTSLPMLVPGFLCLCTAVVFGPRYAVLLHRIQAPERVVTPRLPVQATPASSGDGVAGTATQNAGSIPPLNPSMFLPRLGDRFRDSPGLVWLFCALLLYVAFMFALQPSLTPMFLFLIYSFWLPQIYRNATRGSSNALDWWFVIGTSFGRLALPLYAFACPDNVFFTHPNQWIWGLVAWQWFQVLALFSQDRFGARFFLPKSYALPESYNYHPVLPAPDAENASLLDPSNEAETTCSICMEPINVHPVSNGPSSEALLGLNARRAYALAPCHHLFHTKCLSQWLAIKTICPLCKRSLPPF